MFELISIFESAYKIGVHFGINLAFKEPETANKILKENAEV